jgi:NADH:ubiquinone oxidoreductase subunit
MIIMKIRTWIKGRFVGQDAYGNRYFEEKFLFSKPDRPPKRWVTFATEPDASKVPPEWHGWLHFTYENPLNRPRHSWQKKHLQNLTGTTHAHKPKGSLLNPSSKIKKSYTAWVPSSSNKGSDA